MTDRELMQQALEKLEFFAHIKSVSEDTRRLITALRERLAQPEQEPVAWRYRGNLHEFDPSDWAEGPVTPLYTAPRQWQGLTDDEINQFRQWSHPDIIEAIELKLKEKNT